MPQTSYSQREVHKPSTMEVVEHHELSMV